MAVGEDRKVSGLSGRKAKLLLGAVGCGAGAMGPVLVLLGLWAAIEAQEVSATSGGLILTGAILSIAAGFSAGALVVVLIRRTMGLAQDAVRTAEVQRGESREYTLSILEDVLAIQDRLDEGRAEVRSELSEQLEGMKKIVWNIVGNDVDRLERVANRVEASFERVRDQIVGQEETGIAAALEELKKGQTATARQAEGSYRQIEALLGLYGAELLRAPVEPMGEWAVSPDLASYLVRRIQELKPELVLELGSGVSTVVMAGALEQNGSGTMVALEHDPSYVKKTNALLKLHGVDHRAEVRLSPLVETAVNGESWLWYDFSPESLGSYADIIFVDGPPGNTGPLARYPALPILWGGLAEQAKIIVDDIQRTQDSKIVSRWLEEFPVSAVYVPHQKQTVEMTRNDAT